MTRLAAIRAELAAAGDDAAEALDVLCEMWGATGWVDVSIGGVCVDRVSLEYVAERLLAGHRQYGALLLDTDCRDWPKERAAEWADGVAYFAFDAVKQRRRTPQAAE